jgi:hypothetical protein
MMEKRHFDCSNLDENDLKFDDEEDEDNNFLKNSPSLNAALNVACTKEANSNHQVATQIIESQQSVRKNGAQKQHFNDEEDEEDFLIQTQDIFSSTQFNATDANKTVGKEKGQDEFKKPVSLSL